MKPTIWIFAVEPIDTRYTQQWYEHFPALLDNAKGNEFNVVQIAGIQQDTKPTPGAFLNFSDTNYWKSSQLCKFLEHYNNGETTANDHFVFTDAWCPTVIQLKYMTELLGLGWTLHGLWHAGSYDPQDFLGRLVGDKPWVRQAERSFYHAFDYNYFATDFHIDMFAENLLKLQPSAVRACYMNAENQKIVRTGWPMEYMTNTLENYNTNPKRDLILFPHRIAPEKQVEIFRDLSQSLPQYEFVVCQDQKLSKHEYHTLLGQAKIVFSANLQETLGISCYEGALVDAIPMVPDRLSYTEMYYEGFKYPSRWTESWDDYLLFKQELCHHIIVSMTHYEKRVPQVRKQAQDLTEHFFSANKLVENIK